MHGIVDIRQNRLDGLKRKSDLDIADRSTKRLNTGTETGLQEMVPLLFFLTYLF